MLKAGTLVRRNPGCNPKNRMAKIIRFEYEDRITKSYVYTVEFVDGPKAGSRSIWSDEFFHVVIPDKIEVGGVTTPRREVSLLEYPPKRGTGMKFDGDKIRTELLLQGMPRTLEGISDILTFGARKYAAHSWQGVEDGINRYEAAAMRHKLARMKGEVLDPESGKPHIMHELCSLMFVAELQAIANESKKEN